MDANHLTVSEINFELLSRQIIPARNEQLQRAQLRAILVNELETANKKFVQPFEFNVNVEEIKTSIAELETIVGDETKTPSLKDCARVQSRIIHLNGRLALLLKSSADKEEKDVVGSLSSDVLAMQGLLLSRVELNDFSPVLSSTVNSVESTSTSAKSIPVYKWNLQFSGLNSKESLMSFLEKVEDLREARSLTEHQLFTSAHDLFSGFALQWYRNVKSEVSSWKELVKCLKRDFLPYEYELDLQNEIRNRTQGVNENVIVFIVAIESLYNRLDQKPTEKEIVRQIIRNLNHFFSQHLALREITSLSSLKETCRQIQELKVKIEKYKPPPQKRSGLLEPDLACLSLDELPVVSRVTAISESRSKRRNCWNCHSEFHTYATCTAPRNTFCYGCGKPGVYKPSCSKCSPVSTNTPINLHSENARHGGVNTGTLAMTNYHPRTVPSSSTRGRGRDRRQ